MASLYIGIRTKNTEFRHVPSLRKVGYTWCQKGPETNAGARLQAKCDPSEQNPGLFISHNHLRRALDQTLQPGIKTAILCFKRKTLDSTKEISLGASFGKLLFVCFYFNGIIIQTRYFVSKPSMVNTIQTQQD